MFEKLRQIVGFKNAHSPKVEQKEASSRMMLLEQEIATSLGVERVPHLRVKASIGTHASEEHAAQLPDLVKKAQIVFIEGMGYSEDDAQTLQEIAEGKKLPIVGAMAHSDFDFSRQEMEMIYGSQKVVKIADLRQDDAELKQDEAAEESLGSALAEIKDNPPDLQSAVNKIIDAEEELAVANIAREEKVVKRLKEGVIEGLKSHKNLLESDEVNILLIFGGAHSGLLRLVAKVHPSLSIARRDMENGKHVFDQQTEYERTRSNGTKAEDISDDLKLRVFFHLISMEALGELVPEGVSSGEHSAGARKIIDEIVRPENQKIIYPGVLLGKWAGKKAQELLEEMVRKYFGMTAEEEKKYAAQQEELEDTAGYENEENGSVNGGSGEK